MRSILLPELIEPAVFVNTLQKRLEKELAKSTKQYEKAKKSCEHWESRTAELKEALASLKAQTTTIKPAVTRASKPERTVNLSLHKCDGCGSATFIELRHQGNRYGNFMMYKCAKCGMRKNIKDSEINKENNNNKVNNNNEEAASRLARTEELRKVAQQAMGVA